MEHSSGFVCQKYTLFTVSLLMLIGAIVLGAKSADIVDSVYETDIIVNLEDREVSNNNVRDNVKGILIASAVITGLFAFSGIMGALKEHYCATMTFAVFMTINSLSACYLSSHIPTYWASVAIDIAITVLAYSFARAIRAERLQFLTRTAMTPLPHTIIQVPNMGYAQTNMAHAYTNVGYAPTGQVQYNPVTATGWTPYGPTSEPPPYDAEKYAKQ